MKKFKFLLSLLAVILFACSDDDRNTDFLDEAQAPSNIDLTFLINNDNSGLVEITPTGEAVTQFEVFFGDDSNSSVVLLPGESTTNNYDEGNYSVRVIATGVNGDTTEYTEELMVSFLAPQNLEVTIDGVPGDVFGITVSATADLEAYFEFYPGVSEDEEPIQFMEGETITYTYDAVGEYQVRIIAYSGGEATTEFTQTVIIQNPVLLPITFEDETLNYGFIDFEGAQTTIIDNPVSSENNDSDKVAQTIKGAGSPFFAGTIIELGDPIDFSQDSRISVDVYSPKAGAVVKLKLENLNDQNISTEVDAVTSVSNAWETLTYDFSESDLSQSYQKIIIFFDFNNDGDGSTYYWDNVNLTSNSGASEPTEAAPTPNQANVISMFSDVYDDVPVDTWNTSWSDSDFEDIEIEGNATKKYFNLGFNGIETVSTPIDASGMTHFHMDVWTPNATAFRIKLVDFLGDGFQGGNGDTEAELTFNPEQGQWVSLDIPLADFAAAGMTSFSDLNQYIISADPFTETTIFVDNVYFYSSSDEPLGAAPDPTLAEANVISMFSDVYTDVNVDTWNTSWSNSDFEDISIDGNATKLYTNLGFNGIETTSNPIDASGMTHFHMDIWTPNITTFRIKLVDFLGDGFQGGNGDTEAELTFTPSQAGWVSLDIPLSQFGDAGMSSFSDINQYIISCEPFEAGTVYIDNVYFHN